MGLFKLELFLNTVHRAEVVVGHVLETLEVESVEAVCRLEHAYMLLCPILFTKSPHAEVTHFQVLIVRGQVLFCEVLGIKRGDFHHITRFRAVVIFCLLLLDNHV